MVRFFTFEQFHGKRNIGSSYLRVHQLIKYWPESGVYKFGENPDVMIFQKVYCAPDYKFPANFKGIKILDICDPDWLNGVTLVKDTVDAVSAVTCSSERLQSFLQQLTDKPVVYIPDRFDISIIPAPKIHKGEAKTVVWFGYRHNASTLRPALPVIERLGLDLIVIAEDDPLVHRNSTRAPGWYKFIKYNEETIYEDLQKADFAVLPYGTRPIDYFKSNNKMVKAQLAGLPVARDSEECEKYMKESERVDFINKQYDTIKEEYDVRKSVEQMKKIIKDIRGKHGYSTTNKSC